MAKQDVHVEVWYDAAWHEVAARTSDPITITRGAQNEDGSAPPARISLTLDNRDGSMNPRNPSSALFGKIGRNTPLRIRQGATDVRFEGEVASWQPRSTVDFDRAADRGDAWCEVEAAGVRRRLGQGADPLGSAIYRAASRASPTAYWPLEDATDARAAASGIGGAPMTAFSYARFTEPGTGAPVAAAGLPKFATGTGIPGSAPVVDLTQGGNLIGPVPPNVTSFSRFTVEWWMVFKRDGSDGNAYDVLSWMTSGTYVKFTVTVGSNTVTVFHANAADAAALANTGRAQASFNAFDGRPHHYRYDAQQSGSTVLAALYIDGNIAANANNFTPPMTGTWGPVTSVQVNPVEFDGDVMPAALGHIVVYNGQFSNLLDERITSGYTGERAGDRFIRVMGEEGLGWNVVGDLTQCQAMGPQYPDTLTALLAELEITDQGVLREARTGRKLEYRTGRSLYAQTVVLALDVAAGQVLPPLDPDVDDQRTRNDITVSRRDGATARAVRTSGPLNVSDPTADPDGVGRVTGTVDINPASDAPLLNHAYWHLTKGTVPDTRYPAITVDVEKVPTAATVEPGHRITVAGILDQPDLADLMVLGYVERIESHRWLMTFHCAPYSPWRVGKYGDSGSRYDTSGSTLQTGVSASATSLSVATTAGPLWTTRAAAFPFDITVGGERMTVTNITGAASPQTFTVTRAVNGVAKAHLSGARVRLFAPVRYGL